MPWNPDGTRKRSSLYKKSSGFKMKSPLKHPTHEDHHKKSKKGMKKTHPDYFKGVKKRDFLEQL